MPCTECAARSLAYDFRRSPYEDRSNLIDAPRLSKQDAFWAFPAGRCREFATDLSYSAMCRFSGGRVGEGDWTRTCSAATVDPSALAVMSPDAPWAETAPALAPGALADARTFCGAMGAVYSFSDDFCLRTPYKEPPPPAPPLPALPFFAP